MSHHFSNFSEWWKQLVGESEGKETKRHSISANFSTDLHSLGQFIQEGTLYIMFLKQLFVLTNSKTWLSLAWKKTLMGLGYLQKDVDFCKQKDWRCSSAHTRWWRTKHVRDPSRARRFLTLATLSTSLRRLSPFQATWMLSTHLTNQVLKLTDVTCSALLGKTRLEELSKELNASPIEEKRVCPPLLFIHVK